MTVIIQKGRGHLDSRQKRGSYPPKKTARETNLRLQRYKLVKDVVVSCRVGWCRARPLILRFFYRTTENSLRASRSARNHGEIYHIRWKARATLQAHSHQPRQRQINPAADGKNIISEHFCIKAHFPDSKFPQDSRYSFSFLLRCVELPEIESQKQFHTFSSI